MIYAQPNQKKFGLYIHWPFCLTKCPYCDFNSHVRTSVTWQDWLKGLKQEMCFYGQRSWGHSLSSIFFGGGTPSLMPPKMVEELINTADKIWPFTADIEISLEANPSSIENQKIKAYRDCGVNRLSIGVQSLMDDALKLLGRYHNRQQAMQAIDIAGNNFENFSFDLIYARPQQHLNEWEKELKMALTLAANHLSLYQLTIEPGTAFEKSYQAGYLTMPTEELSADFYNLTNNITMDYGFHLYEVSNYAKSGYECRHNLTYWNYQDYIGIGPGAHGRLSFNGQKFASLQTKIPESWLHQVIHLGHGTKDFYCLTLNEQIQERLLMGLRLSSGIDISRFNLETGNYLSNSPLYQKLLFLHEQDLITVTSKNFAVTANGRLRLNSILRYLLANTDN